MAMRISIGQYPRAGLFLLAWLAVWGVWVAIMAGGSGMDWRMLVLTGLPMTAFYAAACLSADALCRIFPLRPARFWGSLLNQAAAAVTLAFIWVLSGHGLARFAPGIDRQHGLLFVAGVLLYLLASAGFYAAHAIRDAWQAQRAMDQAQLLARDAELRALRAQINPHFLFNSLHSISALAGSDPPRARQMCLHLAEMFRLSLQLGRQEMVSLADELKLLRAYLAVEQVRFGRRLRFEDEVDGSSPQATLPSLLLQPLVENAVKHGIAGMTEGGAIRLAIATQSGVLRITLENDYDPESISPNRNGVGLQNLRQRLETRYGTRAGAEWTASQGRFRVRLHLPYEPAAPAVNSGVSA